MTDTVKIILEILRALITGGIFFYLLAIGRRSPEISKQKGWPLILYGFGLLFFGTLIDITDNFSALNRFIIIGDTPIEAFLEKAIGYTLGAFVLFVGFLRWFPMVFVLKKQERIIAQQAMVYRQSVENAPIAVFSIERDGRFYTWNRASEKVFGYSMEELQGKDFSILVPQENTLSQLREKIDLTLKGQSFTNLELVLRAKDGSEKTLLVTITPVYNHNMEIVRCGFACVDITEKVRLQKEMERLNRMDSLAVLAGGIAHDFNNLLTGIMGNIGLAKSALSPESNAYDKLIRAERACDTARELVNQIMLFARGKEPEKLPFCVRDLLKENIDLIFRPTDIETEVDIPEDLWRIEADPGQISQALQNILINAREAVSGTKNPKVSVKAENYINENGRRFVRISIRDNGPGIAEELIPRIFEPFFTTKTRGNTTGTGLGLAIAYSVVERHEGQIEVKSKKGQGAEFSVLLPATDREPELSSSGTVLSTRQNQQRPSELRVLVMDDEEIIRDVVSEMIRTMGFVADTARNGEEALRMCRESVREGHPYDIAILDLTVSHGGGALEVIDEMKRILPQIKAIVSSGYSTDETMVNYHTFGFSASLPKPFRYNQLYETIIKLAS